MYVIYPADEIISLTYGVRRFLPRPTLDNLRKPLVPVDTPTKSHLSLDPLFHKPIGPDPDYSRNNSEINQFSENNLIDSNTELSSYDHLNAISNRHNFGRLSFTRSNLDRINTFNLESPYSENQFELRPCSAQSAGQPSIFITKPQSTSLSYAGKPPAAKKKSKLQMKLAKLGRPHSNPESNEPTRVLEYQDIVVSNPTFTRDNLSARNFDAFFESGEPVYSIETKEKTTPVIIETDTFCMPSSPTPTELLLLSDETDAKTLDVSVAKPKSRLIFFKRNKDQPSAKQSPIISSVLANDLVGDDKRLNKSSDIFLLVEESQKGDRCTL